MRCKLEVHVHVELAHYKINPYVRVEFVMMLYVGKNGSKFEVSQIYCFILFRRSAKVWRVSMSTFCIGTGVL